MPEGNAQNERLIIRGKSTPDNSHQCEKMLTPRDDDEGKKSSWACPQNAVSSTVTDTGVTVSEQLHALSLFVNGAKGDGPIRSECAGISIARCEMNDHVMEDAGEHLVPQYDSLHRSIVFPDAQTRSSIVLALVQKRAISGWQYLRADLVGLLRELMIRNLVRPDLLATAQKIIQNEPAD